MPPHSEVENDPLVEVEARLRKRRKRSRSISPRYFRKTSEQREFNNNSHDKCYPNKNTYGASTNSSRSSSVSSEIRALWLDANVPIVTTRNPAVVQSDTSTTSTLARPVVVGFHDAPAFLQFNPFIYRGYRTNLGTGTCIKRYNAFNCFSPL